MVTRCAGAPDELLQPRGTWPDPTAYDRAAAKLAAQFADNLRGIDDNAARSMEG
jgi:phosphoenolpyruvate carboxykinase (ATP)